ncbi:MAG: DUF2783 domain-containing protein [Gammaproteobacteria bacterium]|nr:DUF2783 domain-containing protein [Gammaproteobacteria bacterium]NNL99846.1 DUF2783 domain-containing protein [Gammaproteobacteria bacterium]
MSGTGSNLHTDTLCLSDPDEFYARLIALHDGLTPEQSHQLNARIIMLMANELGDDAVLAEILTAAAPD